MFHYIILFALIWTFCVALTFVGSCYTYNYLKDKNILNIVILAGFIPVINIITAFISIGIILYQNIKMLWELRIEGQVTISQAIKEFDDMIHQYFKR